ncbi:Cobyrinic acid A C-diamide synthase [Paramagnetospirillum magnetotacticum MS-1]|uniref:Cobyrinate a,c-diamide synthase n=1 Tax=Paramagnetospirillum magnetotacticum MS-1 TaxID=272627 RepID=A0A0C2YIU0_PARME|nr:cobyrinate a,c-diamide synthase [Paramagnetospirillum magnetotacticum]KIL99644.1 Cobyrinic acid A C-diamide synthase [Paramagnetospirillum magnetotacticum MS-1]
MVNGIIIAAPASGSGKTTLTLGLLRLLARKGVAVGSAKVGPDYIDPAFHAAASGRPCYNLDSWAMRPATLAALAAKAGRCADLLVCEGVMGLFDGAFVAQGQPDGSTADLAAATGWPVVLVIDGRGMTGSAAAVLAGFAHLRSDLRLRGVIFNRVMGEKHKAAIAAACAAYCPEVTLLGFLPPSAGLETPSRHLGLVQAAERADLQAFLDGAAALVAEHLDVDGLINLAEPSRLAANNGGTGVPPLGRRIAVARDTAFAFAYPALLEGWREAGAELSFFSPLADQGPDEGADSVYLPGGYPELHAGRLAGNAGFLGGLRGAASRGAVLYGECGGYMVLGRGMEDAQGGRHEMAGLLGLETSFARRKLHLGYRHATLAAAGPLGRAGAGFRGHEFHYASILAEEGAALFSITDAPGTRLGMAGLVEGRVMGSFVHLIDSSP